MFYFHPSRFKGGDTDVARMRLSTAFVPTKYEPRYAYPLLVLFHGRGGDEQQLLKLMPQLSNRNYVAVALRGPASTRVRRDGSVGYCWAQAGRGARVGEGAATALQPRVPQIRDTSCDFLAKYVSDAIAEVRARLNIHTGRVFLMGYGEGAAAAYRLGLGMPSRFAGLVAVNGWIPKNHGPLIWLPEARRLNVLIAHGRNNRLVPLAMAEHAHRLLHTAGIDTELKSFDSDHRIGQPMLRHIDHWLMDLFALPNEASTIS